MKPTGLLLLLIVAATCTSTCAPVYPTATPNPVDERRERREQAAVFVRLGCHECHAISALGVRASADAAPDLTHAYADVVIRYGVNLESFLAHPTGVMRLMLGAHLDVSVADREAIVRILKRLHEERIAAYEAEGPLLPPWGASRP